ncbi:MAG: DUF881 domain-containing protein [Actinomycetota bacterium]
MTRSHQRPLPWSHRGATDLLTLLAQHPLDPGYEASAHRRVAHGQQASINWGRSFRATTGILIIGALLATAWVQARRAGPTGAAYRQNVMKQIGVRTEQIDIMERETAVLSRRIEAARIKTLSLRSHESSRQLSELLVATGAQEITGAGVVITMDDASGVTVDVNSQKGRVLDQDIQAIVNGLWHSGARAVAINGHRLTTRSAIRSAGEAILVNYRPLARPYRVEAVGDNLQTQFEAGAGGRDLSYLTHNFRIRADVQTISLITLPGVAALTVRSATPNRREAAQGQRSGS